MAVKLNRYYDNFIIFIIFIKIVFVVFALIERYYQLKIKQGGSNLKENTAKYNWAVYWKERLEFIFIILVSLVCLIVFFPFYKNEIYIDTHTRLLLFIYGAIIIITANWSVVNNLPQWFIEIQNTVGKSQVVMTMNNQK